MNNQNIIVYQFNHLYQILKELEEDINFKIIEISDEKTLTNEIKKLDYIKGRCAAIFLIIYSINLSSPLFTL